MFFPSHMLLYMHAALYTGRIARLLEKKFSYKTGLEGMKQTQYLILTDVYSSLTQHMYR